LANLGHPSHFYQCYLVRLGPRRYGNRAYNSQIKS
jgi:hypothetical protein